MDVLKQDEGRCGLGGKVNTNPGKQNARFRGSKICANRAIRGGEEIFVPYRGNFKLEREIVDDERQRGMAGESLEGGFLGIWDEKTTDND